LKRYKDKLEEFRTWLTEEQGLGRRTADTYRRCVQASLRRKSILSVVNDVSASKSTRTLYRSALVQWSEFLGNSELAERIKSKKISKSIKRDGKRIPKRVRPIPQEQMRKFIQVLDSLRGADGIEAWVWPGLSLFRKLALRAGIDLCQIQRDAVIEALETGSLQIYTKGDRIREVPTGQVQEELMSLLDLGEWGIVAELISPRAHPNTRMEAAYKRITYWLKAIAEASGMDPTAVHSHRFRHSRAMEVYRKTKDIRIVQKLLGHASISTTQHYLQIDLSEVDDSMKGLD
jgi:site-specific recombinase XerD